MYINGKKYDKSVILIFIRIYDKLYTLLPDTSSCTGKVNFNFNNCLNFMASACCFHALNKRPNTSTDVTGL